MSYFSGPMAALSGLERILMVDQGYPFPFDDTTTKAYEQMKSVKVPTYYIDIFKRNDMAWAKALFSLHYKEDPTPGFGFSAISRKYGTTLEGYYVDKHLSSSISNKFMIEVLRRIEAAVEKQLQNTDISKVTDRSLFYCNTIQSFGGKDTFVGNFREVNVEVSFMFRVTERLQREEEAKLYKELPFPAFSNPENTKCLQEAIKDTGVWEIPVTNLCPPRPLGEADRPLYTQYLKNLFDERDRRMLKILKETFQKDVQAREKNPSAPLTHFVTLEKYEKEITRKRQILLAQVMCVALGIFFLQKPALSLLKQDKRVKVLAYLFLFARPRWSVRKGFFVVLNTLAHPVTKIGLNVISMLFNPSKAGSRGAFDGIINFITIPPR